jgi:hypothetical protein
MVEDTHYTSCAEGNFAPDPVIAELANLGSEWPGPGGAGTRGFLFFYMVDFNTCDKTGTMGTNEYKVAEVPSQYEDPGFFGDIHSGSHGISVRIRDDLGVAPLVLTVSHDGSGTNSDETDCVAYIRVGVNSGLEAYDAWRLDNPSKSFPGFWIMHRSGQMWFHANCRVEAPMPPPSPPDSYNAILAHDIFAGSSYTYAEATVWGHVDGTDHGNIGTTIPVTEVLIFRHKSTDVEIDRHYTLLLATHKKGTFIPQYESGGRRRAEGIALPDAETDGVSDMAAPMPKLADEEGDDDSDLTSRRLSEPEESPSPGPDVWQCRPGGGNAGLLIPIYKRYFPGSDYIPADLVTGLDVTCPGCAAGMSFRMEPHENDPTNSGSDMLYFGDCRVYQPTGYTIEGADLGSGTGRTCQELLEYYSRSPRIDYTPAGSDQPIWGPAFMPDGTMIGNIIFYVSAPQQSLSSSMVLDETIETFLVTPFTLTLANELNVDANDVTVTAEAGSVNLQIDVVVPKRRGVALLDQMTTIVQDTSYMNALFNTTVVSAGPVALVDFSPPPSPPPYPPSQAPTPPPPPLPPSVADVCAKGALDNGCSPFAGADWSSAMSSYHFYLYDETPDGVDLRLWEWPRVTPKDNMLARNGVCEDGLPSRNASIPEGNYYVAFGGPNCATHHVNLSTGLIAGCGRVDLVPCTWGTDCFDCGRSATMKDVQDEYNRRPKYEPYPRRTANARRRLEEEEEVQAFNSRRRMQSLPALHKQHEMRGLARALKTASSYHLPKPWLDALQIKDHLDA